MCFLLKVLLKKMRIFIIIAGIFMYSCHNHQGLKKVPEAPDMVTLNVNPDLNSKLYYSSFIDSIAYIQLQTPEGVLIGSNARKVIFSRNQYFLFDENKVYAFNSNGKYLYDIGKRGNGPGELNWLENFTVDTTRNSVDIISLANRKVVRYDINNGNFIDEFTTKFYVGNIYSRRDGNYLLYASSASDSSAEEIDNLVIYDAQKEFILESVLGQPIYMKNYQGVSNNAFSNTDKGVLFTRCLDNNIYLISGNEVSIKYKIDYGQKYELPTDKKFYNKFEDLGQIMDQTDYPIQFSGHLGNKQVLYYNYLIHKKQFAVLYDIIHSILLNGRGINDFDNGPDYFMIGLYQNQLIGITEPSTFIRHFKKMQKQMNKSDWLQYLNDHPQIVSILETSHAQDNPILAVCYMKNKFKPAE